MKCAEQQHLETLNVQATVDFRLDIFSAVVHLIWWAVHIACAFTLVDEITFRFSITIIAGLLSQVYTIAAPVTESYSCNFQHGSCARIAANFAVFLILFGLLPILPIVWSMALWYPGVNEMFGSDIIKPFQVSTDRSRLLYRQHIGCVLFMFVQSIYTSVHISDIENVTSWYVMASITASLLWLFAFVALWPCRSFSMLFSNDRGVDENLLLALAILFDLARLCTNWTSIWHQQSCSMNLDNPQLLLVGAISTWIQYSRLLSVSGVYTVAFGFLFISECANRHVHTHPILRESTCRWFAINLLSSLLTTLAVCLCLESFQFTCALFMWRTCAFGSVTGGVRGVRYHRYWSAFVASGENPKDVRLRCWVANRFLARRYLFLRADRYAHTAADRVPPVMLPISVDDVLDESNPNTWPHDLQAPGLAPSWPPPSDYTTLKSQQKDERLARVAADLLCMKSTEFDPDMHVRRPNGWAPEWRDRLLNIKDRWDSVKRSVVTLDLITPGVQRLVPSAGDPYAAVGSALGIGFAVVYTVIYTPLSTFTAFLYPVTLMSTSSAFPDETLDQARLVVLLWPLWAFLLLCTLVWLAWGWRTFSLRCNEDTFVFYFPMIQAALGGDTSPEYPLLWFDQVQEMYQHTKIRMCTTEILDCPKLGFPLPIRELIVSYLPRGDVIPHHLASSVDLLDQLWTEYYYVFRALHTGSKQNPPTSDHTQLAVSIPIPKQESPNVTVTTVKHGRDPLQFQYLVPPTDVPFVKLTDEEVQRVLQHHVCRIKTQDCTLAHVIHCDLIAMIRGGKEYCQLQQWLQRSSASGVFTRFIHGESSVDGLTPALPIITVSSTDAVLPAFDEEKIQTCFISINDEKQ